MEQRKENLELKPTYTVYIVSGESKIDVTPAVESLSRIDAEGQIAQRVNIQLRNVMLGDVHLSTILQPVDRVFIYADDGTKKEEVFRGFLWDRDYKSSLTDQRLKVTAYDHLIYLQESEDTFYFPSGRTTEEIIKHICGEWAIKLKYSYRNIVNERLALSGRLYDMLTTDILDITKAELGVHYSLISKEDTMIVRDAGDNEEVYEFIAGENVTSTSSSWTMDGVITQLVLIGKEGDNDREPIEIVESRNAKKYGTLQKLHRRDENMHIWSARGRLRYSLMESSDPKRKYEITSPDVPWIRKGDSVYVKAGDIADMTLIVTAVNRTSDIKNSKMTLTMVNASDYIGRLEGVDWLST